MWCSPSPKDTLIRTEFFGRRGVLIRGGLLYSLGSRYRSHYFPFCVVGTSMISILSCYYKSQGLEHVELEGTISNENFYVVKWRKCSFQSLLSLLFAYNMYNCCCSKWLRAWIDEFGVTWKEEIKALQEFICAPYFMSLLHFINTCTGHQGWEDQPGSDFIYRDKN